MHKSAVLAAIAIALTMGSCSDGPADVAKPVPAVVDTVVGVPEKQVTLNKDSAERISLATEAAGCHQRSHWGSAGASSRELAGRAGPDPGGAGRERRGQDQLVARAVESATGRRRRGSSIVQTKENALEA